MPETNDLKKQQSKIYGMQQSGSKREVYSNTVLHQQTWKITNKQPIFTSKVTKERRTSENEN